MRSTKLIITGFMFSSALVAIGCKSDSREKVESAREKVTESQDKVVEQQRDVQEAKADLQQARADFVKALDQRLTDLDTRIEAARTNVAIDQQRLAALRAEALALRNQVADPARPFLPESQATSDRIFRDVDVELNRGAAAAAAGTDNAPK